MLDEKPIKRELQDVKILDTGSTEVRMPDEVPVYNGPSEGRAVGRAILRKKEDGVYADILLDSGTVEGLTGQAIGHRYPHEYNIIAVGLIAIKVEETQAPSRTNRIITKPEENVSRTEDKGTPQA